MISYEVVDLVTSKASNPKASLLVIYTGGTFGMAYNESGSLAPFNFNHVIDKIPELKSLDLKITVISFSQPVDSSNIHIHHWKAIGNFIKENYDLYDGFVVLHGTDTMAYSASALSFMLQGLSKPIILTGAQIPIGSARSDARDNFLTAIEIASAKENGKSIIPEVCIYFNHQLLRGNRAQKVRSSHFAAFESENYPNLAVSGVFIEYNRLSILEPSTKLNYNDHFDANVALFKIFPNIQEYVLESFFNMPQLKGVVMESYGSGNTPNYPWFLNNLKQATDRGIVILNVSQCNGGKVIHGRYETSKKLNDSGVLSGGDMTTEAAITKLMFLLGQDKNIDWVREKIVIPSCGEMSG
ncbi:MAG: asparaginase [Cyclobacteriaceae bacterium]